MKRILSLGLIVLNTLLLVLLLPALLKPGMCSARAAASPSAAPTGLVEGGASLDDLVNRGEGTRVIVFAGREWVVKAGANLPPRGNAWSDAPESVSVDSDGRLHLRIRQIDELWHSAQVIALEPAQYGMYRFRVETPLNDLHPNVVLGMFLYRDDAREIDIEFSKRLAGGDSNALYAVQPSQRAGHRSAFQFAWAGASTHEIHWQADWVCFRSLEGTAGDGPVVYEWAFEQPGVPAQADDLRLQINLWLLEPARQDREVTVILSGEADR
jgi:hypothetical protein